MMWLCNKLYKVSLYHIYHNHALIREFLGGDPLSSLIQFKSCLVPTAVHLSFKDSFNFFFFMAAKGNSAYYPNAFGLWQLNLYFTQKLNMS